MSQALTKIKESSIETDFELDPRAIQDKETLLRDIRTHAESGDEDAIEKRKHWRDAKLDTTAYQNDVGRNLFMAYLQGADKMNLDSESSGSTIEGLVLYWVIHARNEYLDLCFQLLYGKETAKAEKQEILKKTGASIGTYKLSTRTREVIKKGKLIDANPFVRQFAVDTTLQKLAQVTDACKIPAKIGDKKAKKLNTEALQAIAELEAERATIAAQIKQFLETKSPILPKLEEEAQPVKKPQPAPERFNLATLKEEPKPTLKKEPEPRTPTPQPPVQQPSWLEKITPKWFKSLLTKLGLTK